MISCQIDIDIYVIPCEDFPIVSPSFAPSDTSMSDEDISAPISEEEIVTAISELRSRKAPGLDEISLEMLSLGGGEAIRWLKSIFNTISETKSDLRDWQSQFLVPLHKKGSRTICDNYRGIALSAYQARCLLKPS